MAILFCRWEGPRSGSSALGRLKCRQIYSSSSSNAVAVRGEVVSRPPFVPGRESGSNSRIMYCIREIGPSPASSEDLEGPVRTGLRLLRGTGQLPIKPTAVLGSLTSSSVVCDDEEVLRRGSGSEE